MPKMNGRELATRLGKSRPELKVLYVSGYTDGIVRDGVHGALEEGLAFLQKPYTRHALIRKVGEILDSQRVKSIASKRRCFFSLLLRFTYSSEQSAAVH